MRMGETKEEEQLELVLVSAELEGERRKLSRQRREAEEIRHQLEELNKVHQARKEKEWARVRRQWGKVEEARSRVAEAQRQLEGQQDSDNEELKGLLQEETENLEAAQKKFEDLEFQVLEGESAREEQRDSWGKLQRQLEVEMRKRVTSREEKVRRLENLIREHREMDPSAGEMRWKSPGQDDRPTSVHEGVSLPSSHLLSIIAPLHRTNSLRSTRSQITHSGKTDTLPENPENRERDPESRSLSLQTSSFHENSLRDLVEVERKLREAMREKERLLKMQESRREKSGESRNEIEAKTTHTGKSLPHPPFDLRRHVEGSGHALGSCPQVSLTPQRCWGSLVKVGGRIKTWRKRWFVFDTKLGQLSYYLDRTETKRKGVITFQAIDDVYFDHLRRAPQSPHPTLTFCLKTLGRLYYLVAPSDVAQRIWMEVLLTAVEGPPP